MYVNMRQAYGNPLSGRADAAVNTFKFELPDVVLISSNLSRGDTCILHTISPVNNSDDDRFMGDNISVDNISAPKATGSSESSSEVSDYATFDADEESSE